MTRRFLESTLGITLPSFLREWDAQRRAFPPDAPPGDAEFLASLRDHVVHLLMEGRVAETSRFFYALERLWRDCPLIDADNTNILHRTRLRQASLFIIGMGARNDCTMPGDVGKDVSA